MLSYLLVNCRRTGALLMATTVAFLATGVHAQQAGQLTQPIYRVAARNDAQETPKVAARIAKAAPTSPFNLVQRPGEHPLMPALRVATASLGDFDANIADYSAILRKQERINGQLMEEEVAFVKVRNKPFGVYMFFLKPHKGRECLYNDEPNGDKGVLVAMDCGWKRKFGKVELDPEGGMAMKNQKYPIMKLGLRNLVTELIDVATNDVQFGECEVTTRQTAINKRPATLIEVTHPTMRRNFRFHKAQVFIDNELHVPVRYVSFLWPEQPGMTPPLEESYTYLNLKVNNGFTDLDFDKNNPTYFQK